MTDHMFKQCDCGDCHVCVWGMNECLVCKGAEGTLTTDCPKVPLCRDVLDQVFDKEVDYVDGRWIVPPQCPRCHVYGGGHDSKCLLHPRNNDDEEVDTYHDDTGRQQRPYI